MPYRHTLNVKLLAWAASAMILTGCATTPSTPAPIVDGQVMPAPVAQPAPAPTTPVASEPASSAPYVAPAPLPPVATLPPVAPVPPKQPTAEQEKQGRALLHALLPSKMKDRGGWADDIFNAFTALKIPYTPTYFCSALAVIEQESTWQSDPVVPGLDKMVWQQMEERAAKYGIPGFAIQAAMLKTSPDGRSYKARIDALKTETQMNQLFEDMASEVTRLGLPMPMKNPIRTGGPMQVSVEFAEGHARVWPYPYTVKDSIRHEVFTRRGGVYFGIAILLHYRNNYPAMIYRFADYNAGRFSSRNAAFQQAIGRLQRDKLSQDGDLLRYEQGKPAASLSETELALHSLGEQLGLSDQEIRRDLMQEKTLQFEQTALYRAVFELAERKAGHKLPREAMPQIRLNSPKITRKLTTEWFAKRVDGRYQTCLKRTPADLGF
ncbi:hypothetical protein HNQ59_000423 [Chitinivorax tropicus]|uniref:DUF1615 domain-containing protein n=1 Tax=Chitinivorax tropicus TaxID=714531 RepID=A0A840MPJ0_9PROT|nr:DUF1615 domain-containing protein [Chitinivorax tropicus]MBB5017161.1 hypothetical protein [Chitinivorax tropicus]